MQHFKSFDKIYLKQLRRMCLDNGMSIPSFPVSTEFGMYPERIPSEIEKCRVGMETGLFLGGLRWRACSWGRLRKRETWRRRSSAAWTDSNPPPATKKY